MRIESIVGMLVGAASAALVPHQPTWLDGTCPEKPQNKSDFQLGSMAGLWFEYVWEDHVSTGLDHYVCSSFIALSDSDESVSQDFFIYNSMQFPAEQELHGLEILQKQKMGIDPFADEEADAELEAELAAAQEAGDAEAEEAA